MGKKFAASAAAALLLLSVAVPAAFAYQGQVTHQVTVSGPGAIVCNTTLTVTATIIDSTGKVVVNQPVVWKFGAGQSAGDQIMTTSTKTNGAGVTTTTVNLACTLGNRTVVATDAPASGQTVLQVDQAVLGVLATAEPTVAPTEAAPAPTAVQTTAPVAAPTAAPSATAAPAPAPSGSGSNWWEQGLLIVGILILLLILFFGILFGRRLLRSH
jgi:hypothetical protein